MSRKNIIAAVQKGIWAIQPEYAYSSAALIQRLFNGERVFFEKDDDSDDTEGSLTVGCFAVTREGAVAFGNKYNPFENAQPGSTAVISLSGPIMKYDNCGDMGTKSYSSLIKKANSNPNINSIILNIDSPGGTVDGTFDLGTEVENSKKPIVAFVDGLMASAAYRIGSGAKEIIANNETADIGSIGTKLSFMDAQPYYEKLGFKFHSVYADASKDKNKDFHDLQKGNYDLVKQDLNTINDLFLSDVKRNRPNIKETALTGKMFLAKEAINQGLIDAIGNFDYAVDRAQSLASGENSGQSNSNKNQKTHMKKVTLTAAHPAILALCGVTLEAGKDSAEVEMNDELLGKINSALAAGTKASADLSKASTDLIAATEKATGLETKLSEKTKALTDLTAEHETLKKSNPGAISSKKEGDDKVELEAANNEVWALAHNKAVLDNPMFN